MADHNIDELVKKLYEFRDNFIENMGIERIIEKPTLVQAEMEKTLKAVKACESSCSKVHHMLLMGKTLNVMSEYNIQCEEYLSKVVKRDPSIIEAWNLLGETFWKKGNITSAKDCFEGALQRQKDKVSLRSLSMALRQIKPMKLGDEEKNVIESVEYAKEAVQLDTKDGTSWYILGNAYLSLFFVTEQNPKVLLQSLSAYAQAEKVDLSSTHTPELHFNRATAYRYEQKYKLSLEGLQRASTLDPTWPEPKRKMEDLCKYLDKVSGFVEKKGKLKPKRLESLMNSLKERDFGPYSGGSYTVNGKSLLLTPVTFSELNEGANEEKVLLGRVVSSFADLTLVPFTMAMIDKTGKCFSVTIYNLAQGLGMIIGDSVAIPEPYVTHHDVEWKAEEKSNHWKFSDVRIHNPVVLIVNGKKLTSDHCGYIKASMDITL